MLGQRAAEELARPLSNQHEWRPVGGMDLVRLALGISSAMDRRSASARPICGLAASSAKARVVSFTAVSEFMGQCDTSSARALA